MKFLPVVALATLTTLSQAETRAWEKRLAPGVIYRMEVDTGVPRITHILRTSLAAGSVKGRTELGQGVVFAGDASQGRETVAAMGKRTNALATVNADFFPFTGDPLGLAVRDGELLSLPFPGRSVFAWSDKGGDTGIAEFKGEITAEGNTPIALNGLNEATRANSITLFTEKAGLIMSDGANFSVVFKADGLMTPTGTLTGEITATAKDLDKRKVEAKSYVLVATGDKIPVLRNLRTGDKLTVSVKVDGFDWTKYNNAVGGGPNLVSESKVNVDWEKQGFKETFATQRHPRTAIGITADNDLLMVVVEGRQADSDGATLEELANIMLKNGAEKAINLDGGGSSQIAFYGLGMVRPTDKTGDRPVADGITFTGFIPTVEPGNFEFRGNPAISKGKAATYSVFGPAGQVPNHDILWSVRGPGWIDQGGTLHATGIGKLVLMAFSKGHLLKTELRAVAATETPAVAAPPAKKAPKKKVVVKRPEASSEDEEAVAPEKPKVVKKVKPVVVKKPAATEPMHKKITAKQKAKPVVKKKKADAEETAPAPAKKKKTSLAAKKQTDATAKPTVKKSTKKTTKKVVKKAKPEDE